MTRGTRVRGTRGRSAGRRGLVLPLLAALIVVAPLGWWWQGSRVPETFSVMQMGYADLGGGPLPLTLITGRVTAAIPDQETAPQRPARCRS